MQEKICYNKGKDKEGAFCMNFYLTKIEMCLKLLRDASRETVAEIPLLGFEAFDYKKGNTPPQGDYAPFSVVDGRDKRFWLRAEIAVPQDEENRTYFIEMNTGVTGWDACNPQMILYLDGEMACGMDINHTVMPLSGGRTYDMAC